MAGEQFNPVVRLLRRIVAGPAVEACTDGQLLERFATHREETSFELLLERHGAMVLGVCRRVLADAHEAEDAFQATFLILARKAGAIRKRSSLASWLYGVAYRTALRARAGLARRRVHERQVRTMPEPDPTAEAAWRELRPLLDEELDRLPDKYRSPLVLCYLEGKTNVEAARALGWTKGTVSGRLARARDLLRQRLARRGLVLSAGLLTIVLAEETASAAVPAGLAHATVRAAAAFAAGPVTAGAVSTPVAALAEGVMKTMFLTKIKIAAVVLLAVGALGTGVGVLGPAALAGRPAEEGQAQADKKADAPKVEDDPAKLRKEIERLKAELEKLRTENANLKREAERAREVAEVQARQAALQRDVAEVARLQAEAALAQARVERARALEKEAAAKKDAEPPKPPPPIPRNASANNLKQIGVAVHKYEERYQRFPTAAISDKGGKPLLSWRVAILPFLGEEDLYKQFKLDEPWDSAHNKKLLAKMPKVYTPVAGKPKDETTTFYQAFVGKEAVFDSKQGRRMADIRDGTANTVMIAEAGEDVPWTKPADMAYAADQPLPKLGGLFDGYFHVLMADGNVRIMPPKPDEKILRAIITIAGGEVLDAPGGR